jgi:hypothetical protein
VACRKNKSRLPDASEQSDKNLQTREDQNNERGLGLGGEWAKDWTTLNDISSELNSGPYLGLVYSTDGKVSYWGNG